MNTSIIRSTVNTIYKKGANAEESIEKYENINIIICPAEILVANRIVNVNGRIIWEKISTKGKNNIKPVGAPYGNIWETIPLKLWYKPNPIIGIQNNKALNNT